jgi:hypothetical protein
VPTISSSTSEAVESALPAPASSTRVIPERFHFR